MLVPAFAVAYGDKSWTRVNVASDRRGCYDVSGKDKTKITATTNIIVPNILINSSQVALLGK